MVNYWSPATIDASSSGLSDSERSTASSSGSIKILPRACVPCVDRVCCLLAPSRPNMDLHADEPHFDAEFEWKGSGGGDTAAAS